MQKKYCLISQRYAKRKTFSQRHHVIVKQTEKERIIFLHIYFTLRIIKETENDR